MDENEIEPPESAYTGDEWAEGPVIDPLKDGLTQPTPLVAQMIRMFRNGDDGWVGIGNVGRWNESPKVHGIRDQLRQFAPDLYLKLMDHVDGAGSRTTLARLTDEAYSKT